MYLLTELEDRTGKYLAPGHSLRNERSEVRAPRPRAKYFPVRPDLNSVDKHFVVWTLYAIHEHSEYEVLTKISKKICTENLSNMLVAFAFLVVNNVDV